MGNIDYSNFAQDSLHRFYRQYVEHIGFSFQKINAFAGSSEKDNTTFNFFLIIFEAISRFPEFHTIELQQHQRDKEAWKKVIANAKQKGEIRTSSSETEIANLFLYIADGAFIRYINNDNKSSFGAELLNAYNTLYNTLKS